jgi:hypothetical protein
MRWSWSTQTVTPSLAMARRPLPPAVQAAYEQLDAAVSRARSSWSGSYEIFGRRLNVRYVSRETFDVIWLLAYPIARVIHNDFVHALPSLGKTRSSRTFFH